MYSPKFTINSAILRYIGKIEASKEVIENAPLVPAYEAKFRQEAIIRTVHHGTHIEGNPLDTGEVAAVLEGEKVDAKDRDVQEVLNYREVLKYIDKSQSHKESKSQRARESKFTEKDLLTIHRLTVDKVLAADKAGKYRVGQVVVKNSKTGQISFVPPKAGEVRGLVGDFLKWLNSGEALDLHPVLKAGIVHYVLAFIHPFVDGNGRASRAFATLVLFSEGYDIKKFFSLEEYFDRDAKRYYATLQSISNQKVKSLSERELTPWLTYFCQGLAEELERVKQKVQKLSLDSRLKGRTGQIMLSERQVKLVEYMETYGSISNSQWRNVLRDFSDDTILRDLKDLQKKGLIRKKGSTKGAVYILK
ncbi:MAG: Fic family protein [Candidatus Curtissbacteria bacterium]|nr:Fic family protein [Candidatus Curtissbacteria bacterium]